MARYPAAVWFPGPPHKLNSGVRRGKGVVVHSAEGPLSAALSVLMGPREASWHFTVAKDGSVHQHYDSTAQTWHAGTRANPYYAGIECEGVAGEILTGLQAGALVDLLKWLGSIEGWGEYKRQATLWEHNEFMATACPSGRIPWGLIIDALTPDEPVTAAQQMKGLIAATFVLSIGNPLSDLSVEDRAAIKHVAGQL